MWWHAGWTLEYCAIDPQRLRGIELERANRGKMKLISVSVGLPRDVTWHGKQVTTGIFKQPVDGRLALRKLNLDGDRQADLSVHGGEDKAVYCYPIEHYEYWSRELPGRALPYGSFGENFTTQGLLEDGVYIGDRFSVGSAQIVVTQPRLPCYKLGIRFGMPDMVKRFQHSGRTGFYLAVLREGEVTADEVIEFVVSDEHGVTVADIVTLYTSDAENQEMLRRASNLAALPDGWRDYFRKRLWKPDA